MSETEIIRGSLSGLLRDKRVVVGLTGSVAVYRAPDVIRELIRHGAYVTALMTRSACKLISPELIRWACGCDVYTRPTGSVEYIRVCERSDALCIVPTTQNTLMKIAHGISDNIVTLAASVMIGLRKPVILVPCMNLAMWNNSIVREGVERLRRVEGVYVLEPEVSEGKAKLPPVSEIVDTVIDVLSPKDMGGLSVLVTGGPTREHIDDVKYITTPSSGLTGLLFAREAHARGASTTLVTGPVELRIPKFIRTFNVISACEMFDVMSRLLERERFDVIVLTAAPVDYTVERKMSGKIVSEQIERLEITLVRTPKIIDVVRRKSKSSVIIGFKAEWGVDESELIERAVKRMRESDVDIIVAHDVSRGLGFRTMHDSVLVIDRYGCIERMPLVHKRELARRIYSKALEIRRKLYS